MESQQHTMLAQVFERIDNLLNLASIKASLLISSNVIFVGLVLNAYSSLSSSTANLQTRSTLNWLIISVLTFSVLSTIASLAVVFSFLGSGAQEGVYTSLIYFGSISEMQLDDYIDKLTSATEDSYIYDLARQVHLLSGALNQKFLYLNWSTIFLGVSLVIGLIATMFYMWGK